MAESHTPDDEIQFQTPVGAIKAHGFNVIVILALVILSWLTFTEHSQRSHEHDEIVTSISNHTDEIQRAITYQACLQKLNLYVSTAREPSKLSLTSMPGELWSCLPKFLSEESQAQRKARE